MWAKRRKHSDDGWGYATASDNVAASAAACELRKLLLDLFVRGNRKSETHTYTRCVAPCTGYMLGHGPPMRGFSCCEAQAPTYTQRAGTLRRIQIYVSDSLGKLVAEDLALISWYHNKSGGPGLDDLMMSPDRTHGWYEKIRVALEREFPEPLSYAVETPVHDKVACTRSKLIVPIRLPTVAIAEIVAQDDTPADSADPSDDLWGPLYSEHPTVVRAKAAGMSWKHIRPLGIYADGVPYTKHETYSAISVHDLRSGVKIVSCVMSPCHTCKRIATCKLICVLICINDIRGRFVIELRGLLVWNLDRRSC